ncbi:YeeE/YedE thiosulfate transporter family protein [Acidocella sp.]|uniref:YeeE/YedE thiosulfate transporter family protein n=1 Tax=Acidocella sp. TaxID=50710 RepID=UPI0026155272|nr:YeeE/YedE thiosulfate transporter family protein [Acidocella sp.]
MANPRPRWNSYLAGVALGVVLFAAFLATGHGLGVTGATTGVTAVAANAIRPGLFAPGSYLAGYVRFGLNHWIEWEVLGVLIGGVAGSALGRRFAPRIDGPPRLAVWLKLPLAFIGGAASGFGARMAMGCTSGMGLSGSAPLAAAGFLFLIGFFVAGALAALPLTPLWRRR